MPANSPRGPNFPQALAIEPSAPLQDVHDQIGWRHDSSEDIVQYGIAGRIWEAAFLLMRYVETHVPWVYEPRCTISGPDVCTSCTILELGSGAGTGGLAVANALAHSEFQHTLIMSDLPEVVPLLQRNISRANIGTSINLQVCALPWGDACAAKQAQSRANGHLTHILCSDLVYFPELLCPLLRTLLHLTQTSCEVEVIIAYKIRSLTKEQPFWAAFGSWFDFEPVRCAPKAHANDWVLFGSDAAHLANVPSGPVVDDYFVFIAHRKRHTLHQTAPVDDQALLAGYRVVDAAQQIYSPDLSGTETFEWLMLNRFDTTCT